MNNARLIGQLNRLARLYNIQTAFYSVGHHRRTASVESLLALLKALGAPVASLNDVASARRERDQSIWRRILEPVTIAWDGLHPAINVCLPSEIAEAPYNGRLELESGEVSEWKLQAGDPPIVRKREVEGKRYVVKKFILPASLPFGYHEFILDVNHESCKTMIISAPRKTYSSGNDTNNRVWGSFLPLYALKTAHDWGSGDYSGLGRMVDWLAGEGGNIVGTLPLLPVFLDEPYEPSPYAPVSRLLWNEFYVDVSRALEPSRCPSARALVESPSFKKEIEGLQRQAMVDYRRIMSLKRQVMEELSACLLDSGGERLEDFRRFSRENPVVAEYARFRATMEKYRTPWTSWPPRLRDGVLKPNDYEEGNKNYYLYAQWLAWQQVSELYQQAYHKGVGLYFDLPLGVHPDGYDAWRHHDIFIKSVRTGAPPDSVFLTGQDWGLPPLHPEKIRTQGYRYIREYLRHHLRYAAMLRIDHVMGLHRLYWIPTGFDAAQGVYVRYRPEELYAILAVESHRHRSVIVGEDLGTVPGYVRPAMAGHGLSRMYILYYELTDGAARSPRRVPRNSITGLNTHDMAPFASFWEGADIREKVRLGILQEKETGVEKKSRRVTKMAMTDFLRRHGFLRKAEHSTRAALKACLAFLSASQAHTLLINIEDLWLESQPQNVPGVGARFPSWLRKARYGLEEFCRTGEVGDILKEVNRRRKRKKGQG